MPRAGPSRLARAPQHMQLDCMCVKDTEAIIEPSQHAASRPSSSVRRTRQPCELAQLFEPEVNVALLGRAHSRGFLAQIADAMGAVLPDSLMLTVRPTEPGRRALRDAFSVVPGLAEDVGTAVELLADLTDASVIGIRLARVQHAMCPRLHVDRVTLRSVITYVGPGTEFVDSSLFDRGLLAAAAGLSPEVTEAGSAARIEQAATGEVVFLKGERWPGNAGKGAVHRSPPASREAPRLVLTLDAL
ncbi:MAG: DUF1826 domain-containing protein [Polyangiales bacterium]